MDPQGEKAENVWEDVVDAEGCQGWPTLSLGSTQKRGWGWRGRWGGRGNASELTSEGRRKSPVGQSLGKGGRQSEWTEPKG